MNKIAHSLKWVFSTIVLRRVLSFLLFLYIIRTFSRAEYGMYRQFMSITTAISVFCLYSFGIFNIVEQTKKYFKLGLQFVIISSALGSLVLFSLRYFFSAGEIGDFSYNSDLFYYILFGFWLVVPETLKRLISSIHQLDMNFKLKSVAETTNIIVFCLLTLALLFFDKKFYYYVIAFYIGGLVELIMLSYPIRKELITDLLACLRLKYLTPLKNLLKEKFAFLSLTTVPTVINIFIADAPLLLFGFFYTATDIGNYSAIAQLIIIPVSFLTLSLSQVYFPVFSEAGIENLPSKILQYLKHVVIILWYPILIFGILLKYWSYLLLGNQDIALITAILVLLVPRTLFSLILNPLSCIPTILKKPEYELYWNLFSLSLIILMIFFLKNQEFLIMVSVYSLVTIFTLLCFTILIFKMTGMKLNLLYKWLGKGIIYNLPLFLVLFFVKYSNNFQVISLLSVSALMSGAMLYIFEKEFILNAIKKFRSK